MSAAVAFDDDDAPCNDHKTKHYIEDEHAFLSLRKEYSYVKDNR